MATIRLVQLVPRPACTAGTRYPGWLIALFFAPRNRRLATPLHCSEVGCMPFLVKAGCSERPFARLHRPVRFRIDRGKVTAPGLFLRCHTEFCLDPFGSELRSSLPFPAGGEPQRSKPVAKTLPGTFQPHSGDRSPSGLSPFRIKAPRRFWLSGLTLAFGPISLRSPEAVLVY